MTAEVRFPAGVIKISLRYSFQTESEARSPYIPFSGSLMPLHPNLKRPAREVGHSLSPSTDMFQVCGAPSHATQAFYSDSILFL